MTRNKSDNEKREKLLITMPPLFKARLRAASTVLDEDMGQLMRRAWEKELAWLERNDARLAKALRRVEA
jgi:hypothetical protein